MAFSASDAAFEGFRITRSRPSAVLAWGAVQFVAGLLWVVALITFSGPQLQQLQEMMRTLQGGAPDLAALKAFSDEFEKISPALLPSVAAMLAITAVKYGLLYGAVNRSVLRPDEGGPGWLRFGADELRQVAVMAVVMVAVIGAYLGVSIIAGLFVAFAAVAVGQGLAGLFVFLGIVGAVAAMIWVMVRLSLALPMTFDRGRISIGDAWRLTQGRVWPLLGAYFLSFILSVLVTLLVQTIILAVIVSVPGLGGMAAAQSTDMSSLGAYLTPARWTVLVLGSLGGGLTTAVVLAPMAYAYRALTGGSQRRPEQAF